MAHKYRIEKLEDVEEAYRALYRAVTADDDGEGFVLDVEGAVDATKHAEFRETNRELFEKDKKSTDTIAAQQAKIEEQAKLIADAGKVTDDKVKIKETELTDRIAAIEKSAADEKVAREAAEMERDRVKLKDAIKTAGIEGGVLPAAAPAFADQHVGSFKFVEGTLTPITGDAPTASVVHAGKTMLADEFVAARAKDQPFWFAVNGGDGAQETVKPKPAVIVIEQEDMAKHAEGIQKGTHVVRGFKGTA